MRRDLKFVPSCEHGFHRFGDAREPIVAVTKWLDNADPSITLKISADMMPETDLRGRAAMDVWFEAGASS